MHGAFVKAVECPFVLESVICIFKESSAMSEKKIFSAVNE